MVGRVSLFRRWVTARVGDVCEGPVVERGGPAVLCLSLSLVLLPFLTSIGVLLVSVGTAFHAVLDNAKNELLVRAVGHHLVVLGPYSRDGWNHPGPAMYYLLAAPYRLLGSNSASMYAAASLINAAAVAGMLVIARRRGGVPVLLFTTLGLTVVMHALGTDFLRDPWNPYVTVLPFGFFVFLIWELSAGSAWALPLAAFVGSFVIQTHIGYAPLTIPLAIGGAAWFGYMERRGTAARHNVVRPWIIAAVVLGLMWLPPVVGVFLHTPGDLSRAVHYFLRRKATHSLAQGYRVVAEPFSIRPEWIVGPRAPVPFTGEPSFLYRAPAPWLVVPFLLGVWILWRHRVNEATRLALIVGATCALGVLSVAHTIGPVYVYRLRWVWLLGMMAMIVVTWAAWTALVRTAAPRRGPVLLTPLAIGAIVFTGMNMVSAVRSTTPEKALSATLATLYRPLRKALPNRKAPVVLGATDFEASTYAGGIRLWLERDGIPTRVPASPDAAQEAGKWAVYRGGRARAFVSVASGSSFDALVKDPGQRLVSYSGTLSPSRREAIAAELVGLTAQYKAGTLSAADLLARTAKLSRTLGNAVGVFVHGS